MNSLKYFLIGRLKSFQYAFTGLYRLISKEHSIIVQLIIAIFVTFAGFYFKISSVEWMMQIMAIGFIICIEGINTAIEEMANFIHPDFNEKIGVIKDIAAAAVIIAGITAVIIGIIIYYPKIF